MSLCAIKLNLQLSMRSLRWCITSAALGVEVSDRGGETDWKDQVLGEEWFFSVEQMQEALGFLLLLTAEWGSGNSRMGEGVSGWGGSGEAESRDPCSPRRVGQGKLVFGADLSAAVRVKISTDVQAAGHRSGTKAGQWMLYLLFYKLHYSEDMCEVKIIQLIYMRALVPLIIYSNNIHITLWHYMFFVLFIDRKIFY